MKGGDRRDDEVADVTVEEEEDRGDGGQQILRGMLLLVWADGPGPNWSSIAAVVVGSSAAAAAGGGDSKYRVQNASTAVSSMTVG